MKQLYFLIISILFSVTISAQELKIVGEIIGIDNAEIRVLVLPCKLGEIPIMEKTKCEKGKFQKSIMLEKDIWHLVKLKSNEFNSVFGDGKSSKQKLKNRDISFFVKPNDKISIRAQI